MKNEWARGCLFFLASLTAAWYGSGYLDILSPLAKVLLMAQMYALLVALAPDEWKSKRYQLVGVGLVLAAAPFLLPTNAMPKAPAAVAAVIGTEDWGQVLFILGGASISVAALLYAASLFLVPPRESPTRRQVRRVRRRQALRVSSRTGGRVAALSGLRRYQHCFLG